MIISSNPLKANELESKVSENKQLAAFAERAEFVFVRWAAEGELVKD